MQYREESDSLGNATRTNRRGVALDLFFLSLLTIWRFLLHFQAERKEKKEVEEMIKETRGRAVVVVVEMMMMMMAGESVPIESQPTATPPQHHQTTEGRNTKQKKRRKRM